ncbi:type VI secretion system baseplate subunit TssK [Pendulispora albinea]|uniref:Type VI secretion system baseplate subunit TssK n=1 Tax=Pendulispora albinea TaxID=2741071 RepID=A0ABZ2LQ80_9BACT
MLKKPAWPDKLEMSPHVLQNADAYHEQCAIRMLSRIRDDAWGIDDIEFDVAAMARGALEVHRLESMLPDGTEVHVGPEDEPLVLPLPDLGSRESMRIYVGVPRIRPARANADPTGDPRSHVRYDVQTHAIPDEANGTKPVDVPWLRPNPWLLSEDSRLNGFDVIECARLVRDDRDNPMLDPTFVPPIWRVRASSYLTSQLEELLEALRSRKAWADHWRALDILEYRRQHLRALLGTFVKIVLDLLDRPQTAPHDAYLKLVEMIQALAPFSSEADAPLPAVSGMDDSGAEGTLPPYRHHDLGTTFRAVFAALKNVLSAIGASEHEEVPVHIVQGYPWAHQVDLRKPGIFDKEFFLAVSGQDVEALRLKVPELAKVAPLRELIEHQYATRAGVPLRWRHRPARLPEISGTVYFQLEKQSDVWMAITRSGWMGIQINQVSEIASLALYAVDKDAG